MSEIFKALNAALPKLPWWKKLILIVLYPILWVGIWLAWRCEDNL